MVLNYLYIACSILILTNNICEHKNEYIEGIATKYFLEHLYKNKNLSKEKVLFIPDSLLNNGLFANFIIYSDGNICALSKPYISSDEIYHDENPELKDEINQYEIDYKSKNNINNILLNQLPILSYSTWDNFLENIKNENSCFLEVRHHLKSKKKFLVEIRIIPYSNIKSYYNFFFILNDKNEIIDWQVSENYILNDFAPCMSP